ncbi:PREDICTED: nucleoplasmin-3 [Pygoscelis adeliae]|nr:PREDICTED: nucleoplasmin-3 [Pygoscelis adeliae]
MATQLAYVKRIAACEAGLNSDVAPETSSFEGAGGRSGLSCPPRARVVAADGSRRQRAAASQMAAESSSRRSKRVRFFSDLLFPGCELTASTKSYTFQVDKEDDSDHILALSVVCLTDGAKDECNVVEVVGRNHENQEIAVPVANLKLSCQPLLSLDNFKLQPPVTFRLAAGSGPVHLAGWHQIVHREDASFEEDDDLSEEEEELAPIMPAKK